jgi:hypothetical protein
MGGRCSIPGRREWFGYGKTYENTLCAREYRSHADLRAAPIVAGRELRRLNFGRRDQPVIVPANGPARCPDGIAPASGEQ